MYIATYALLCVDYSTQFEPQHPAILGKLLAGNFLTSYFALSASPRSRVYAAHYRLAQSSMAWVGREAILKVWCTTERMPY
jgi:hypothetical protein